MKRICAFICLLFVLLSLFSCTSDKIDLPAANYSLTFTEVYSKVKGNQVKLMYPTVSGYMDSTLQEEINTAALALVQQEYERSGLIASADGGYTYTATDAYITLATADFYSVCILGEVFSDVSGKSAMFGFTLNCDLQNGVFLETEDIIADYERITQAFKTDIFEEDMRCENWSEYFTKDTLIAQYHSAYGIYPEIYFREGKIGVLVETFPFLGGYAGFTADIRRMQNALHSDHSAIAALCGLK